MDLFNNREKALIIWLVIVFVWGVSRPQIRSSIFGVLRAFFKFQILLILGAMSLYILAIISLLYRLNLWSLILIKDTLYWSITTGFILVLNLNKSLHEEGYFRDILRDTVKIALIGEFLINFYTFSLAVELVLLPILFLIFGMKVAVDGKEEFKDVKKIMDFITNGFGLYLIIYVFGNILAGFQSLISTDNFHSFLLSPLLTISFIPFLYWIALAFVYNELFTYLNIFQKRDKTLAAFEKRKIFTFCNINLFKLNRFIKENRMKLYHLQSRQELLDLFREYNLSH